MSTIQTCAGSGYECGDLNTGPGCFAISCQSCPGLGVCNDTAHKCECTPLSSCASEMRTCGRFFNGCGYEECGTCTFPGAFCKVDGTCSADWPTTGTTGSTGTTGTSTGAVTTTGSTTGVPTTTGSTTGSGSFPPTTVDGSPTLAVSSAVFILALACLAW
jgi:hypothetical protein